MRNGLECLEFMARCAALPTTADATSTNPPSLRRPDVILMDVQMPEMDGYSATRAIRSGRLHAHSSTSTSTSTAPGAPAAPLEGPDVVEWLSRIPIVAMTASAIKGDREKCKESGMDDYLAKPVRGGLLEKMLVKWCSANGGEEFRRRGLHGEQNQNQMQAAGGIGMGMGMAVEGEKEKEKEKELARSKTFPMTAAASAANAVNAASADRAKRMADGRWKGRGLQP